MPPEILPITSFAEIAVALKIEADSYADLNGQLEVFAHRLAIAGLSDSIRERMMADKLRHTGLIADAYKIFKAQCDHEAAIRRIIAPTQAAAPWLRNIIGGGR